MRRALSALGLALTTILAGCLDSESTPSEPLVPEKSQASTSPTFDASVIAAMARSQLTAASSGRVTRGVEDDILRLEAEVPGLGGLFFDRDRNAMVVRVVDDTLHAAAITAVERALPPLFGDGLVELDGIDVVAESAEYPFSYLVALRGVVLSRTVNLDGFLSIDADERTNRVVVGVADETAEAEVRSVVRNLDLAGSPVAVVIERPAVATSSLQDHFRPTGGGIQIVNYGSNGMECTHGWTVTTSLGDTGILTAGHCYGGNITAGNTGQTFYQPIMATGNDVGTVTLNNPWNLSGCWDPDSPSVPWTGPCTRADVMFIGSDDAAKKVAQTPYPSINNNPGTLDFHGWWTSIGSVPPSLVGFGVDKVGRTTGWTRGGISATCKDVKVHTPIDYVVTCSGEVSDAAVGKGDSGAPVFYQATSFTHTLRPLGILFAGTTNNGTCSANCTYYYNDWQQMNYQLNTYFNPS